MQVLAKLEELSRRFHELDDELANPEVIADPERLRKAAKERADLDDIMQAYQRLTDVMKEIAGLEEINREEEDPELLEMAREELPVLKERLTEIENELNLLLLPKDPNDDKNTFLEIRAGTGGGRGWALCSGPFQGLLAIRGIQTLAC